MSEIAICAVLVPIAIAAAQADSPQVIRCEWQPHTVRQYRGRAPVLTEDALDALPAQIQVPTHEYQWGQQFVYMPEKNRLFLQTTVGLYSDDLGATWIETPTAPGRLTHLGDGNALAVGGELSLSRDYGTTWETLGPRPPLPDGKAAYSLGAMVVDRDPASGSIVRLVESVFHDDAYVRFSTDGGRTWPTLLKAPWISETTLIRASNGDLVAATRTDGRASIADPEAPFDWRRAGGERDFYSGLGVSISKDNGQTWSPVTKLYEAGRHHPSMVLLANHDLVMTYVVRLGYDDTVEGLPQYGIEAVVSHDHGQTWDLDHRYVLDRWVGAWAERPGVQLMAPNETDTVLLPDGSLITAYGKGFPLPGPQRGVQLVRWRVTN